MPAFEKILLLSAAMAIVAKTDGLEARPQLPHCKCKQAWPFANDSEKWSSTYGLAADTVIITTGEYANTGKYGLGIAQGVVGCIDQGATWKDDAYPNGTWQICVPDVPDGGCVGIGAYDVYSQAFLMKCGNSTGLTDDHNAVLSAEQLRAADAYEARFAEFGPGGSAKAAPKCKCLKEWDATFSSHFCGSNTPSGKVNRTTCMAPQNLLNSVTTGALATNGSIKSHLVNPKSNWCEVPAGCSSSTTKHVEPCSKKTWIELPNKYDPNTRTESSQVFGRERYFAGFNIAWDISGKSSAWGNEYGWIPLTFMPENVIAGGYENTANYAQWEAAIAASVAKSVKYLPANMTVTNPSPERVVAIEAKRVKEAAEMKIAVEGCDAVAECKLLQDSQKCPALKSASLARFQIQFDQADLDAAFNAGFEAGKDEGVLTHCHQVTCNDNPPNRPNKKNIPCASIRPGTLEKKCNKAPQWIKHKYCRESCAKAGYGYDGDEAHCNLAENEKTQ